MHKKITNTVTWTGKIDWELRRFHGDELSTHKGSSYNAYLIKDKKTVLIDTVWAPFDKEFVSNLKKVTDLEKIDYIIANHGEVDHSGALSALLREIPNTPVYCTQNAIKSLRGQYHENWNFVPVKTGDTLVIGNNTLIFIEAPMLHWPDSMFTYMKGENILFPNDGFGQHLACDSLFNDTADENEIMNESLKYYANILAPFSSQVTRKIKELMEMNLPIEMICPSHGIIWRRSPEKIIEKYLSWADSYQENQISIIYDTMWNSTGKMAQAIAEGIRLKDPLVTLKLFNCSKTDKSDVLTEVFKSRAVIVGSPTVNNGYLYSIAGILELIKGLKLKNKKAVAFGSYGWSGEGVKLINHELSQAGFSVVDDGFKTTWTPDEQTLLKLREYGKALALKLQ